MARGESFADGKDIMNKRIISRVVAISLAVGALAGCTVYEPPYAAGPAPGPYYGPAPYAYAPPAYGPAYVAPSIGLNFGFWDHDGGGWHGGHHHWH
jgi:hypothetical protein